MIEARALPPSADAPAAGGPPHLGFHGFSCSRLMADHGEPLREAPTDHLAAEQACILYEQEAWQSWRADHPPRFSQPLAGIEGLRPRNKNHQQDWAVYSDMRSDTKLNQLHLIVPALVPQPLAGFVTRPIANDPATMPFVAGDGTAHVTNIFRVEALARCHPEVEKVKRITTSSRCQPSIARTPAGLPLGTRVCTNCGSNSQPPG